MATMRGPTKIIICALALVISARGAAAQQASEYRGTEQQQLACTPDVFRLCWSEIPNVSQIVACLVREKPRLSEACRAVFETARPTPSRSFRHHLRHRPVDAEK
jgi:hypothetical protein